MVAAFSRILVEVPTIGIWWPFEQTRMCTLVSGVGIEDCIPNPPAVAGGEFIEKKNYFNST